MRMLSELRASYAFVERNFNLIRRYINWEIVFIFYTIINTLTIGLIGIQAGENGGELVLYLVVGALLWGFLSVLFAEVGDSIGWERWEGTIEYTFMAPVHRLTHLGGVCLFAIIYGTLRTIIVLAAVTFFFDISLQGANLPAALGVLVISSLAFIGLGLMAAVLPLMSPEKGSQATYIIQGFILLISGVYYEIEALPVWLQPLSRISPATYTLRAARAALLEGAGFSELAPSLVMLAITGAALIPIGLFVFSLGERYAMRAGKLKRSG